MSDRTNKGPRRTVILDRVDEAVTRLDAMIGRWLDHIPAPVRAELTEIRAPLEALLIETGLRGQQTRNN